jgi:hypothetical protein
VNNLLKVSMGIYIYQIRSTKPFIISGSIKYHQLQPGVEVFCTAAGRLDELGIVW